MPFLSVFRHKPFATMWVGRLLTTIATFMQSVVVGWSVYSIARQTYDERTSMLLVGLVGFAQFLPMFFLALVAGATADRYDRRIILVCCGLMQTACAGAFTLLSIYAHNALIPLFIVSVFFGMGRAFSMPAMGSIISCLVPRTVLPKALAWNVLSTQIGMVIGPWIGGILCGINPTYANASALGLYCLGVSTGFMLLGMDIDSKPQYNGASRLTMIREGLAHLWDSKIVLGAISLDLFAVFLGGVTALLPAYARDVLQTGPEGFGHLRSAFALGGGLMTLVLAARPITRHAGKWMLGGVVVYGTATLCFAYSRNEALSLVALGIAGCADSISVFVRQSLVQIVTPDAMRGRVSAVAGLFISASNELGEFESGVAARLFGIVGSAAFGGLGSIVVTGLWSRLFPALRKADRLVPVRN